VQDAAIAKSELELKRRADEIERKTRETDGLNRKLEKLLAAQPGAFWPRACARLWCLCACLLAWATHACWPADASGAELCTDHLCALSAAARRGHQHGPAGGDHPQHEQGG
jgi:hypothetical protein